MMKCIVCGESLNKNYYISFKNNINIALCKNHKNFCENDCFNYECVEGVCKPLKI